MSLCKKFQPKNNKVCKKMTNKAKVKLVGLNNN